MTRKARLFNKNITSRKSAKISMGSDVCPVPVSESLVQQGQGLVNGGNNYNSLKVKSLP